MSFQWLSSLFLKDVTDSAFTISAGRLFRSLTTRMLYDLFWACCLWIFNMWPRVTCDGRNLKKTAGSILLNPLMIL